MSNVSIFRANDPYEQLIQQMLVLERRPQNRLVDQRSTQDRLKKVMQDVNSKLSALHTLTGRFTDVIANAFGAKSASLSDTKAFDVSVGSKAASGSHTLEVLRLATADTRISQQLAKSDNDLRSFFDANGVQTFSIEVAHPIDGDPNHRVAIDVTVDPTGSTNEEILNEVRTAIRTAMDQAVADEVIRKDERSIVSVVNETSDTARLSLKSGGTGYARRLSFTDSADGLLGMLDLDNDALAAGTGGGQVTAVGTGETDSELNSKFILDGLTIYRDSNSINDVLADVTIRLRAAGEGPTEFSLGADKEKITSEINDFIKKYNEIVLLLSQRTRVDGDAGVRGDLAGDSTFRSLRMGMRNDLAQGVAGQPADGPHTIVDLGIEIQSDGTLNLKDADKLVAAVEKDAGAVQSLFDAENGIATRLKDRIDRFVGVKGVISDRIKSIDSNIKRLTSRISQWDQQIERREDQLRMQFARLQESLTILQGQQQNMMMLFGGMF